MKKTSRTTIVTICVTVSAIVCYIAYQAQNKICESDIFLANVEALTEGDPGPSNQYITCTGPEIYSATGIFSMNYTTCDHSTEDITKDDKKDYNFSACIAQGENQGTKAGNNQYYRSTMLGRPRTETCQGAEYHKSKAEWESDFLHFIHTMATI